MTPAMNLLFWSAFVLIIGVVILYVLVKCAGRRKEDPLVYP
jgi:hypothetical protein